MSNNSSPRPGDVYVNFNGRNAYVEIPSLTDYSVSTTGKLTIAAWMRPGTLNFPHVEQAPTISTGWARVRRAVQRGTRNGRSARITGTTRWTAHPDRTGSASTCSIPRGDWASAATCKNRFTKANGFMSSALRIPHARSLTRMANLSGPGK
jgi:hypothetical protein